MAMLVQLPLNGAMSLALALALFGKALPASAGGAAISIGVGTSAGLPLGVLYAPYEWRWGDPYWAPYWAGSIYWPHHDPLRLRIELDRMERSRSLRVGPDEWASRQAPENLWDGGSSPWGYVKRVPPPTSEQNIQPEYRGASQIRPEYQRGERSVR